MREVSKPPWVMEPNPHHNPETMKRVEKVIERDKRHSRMTLKGAVQKFIDFAKSPAGRA